MQSAQATTLCFCCGVLWSHCHNSSTVGEKENGVWKDLQASSYPSAYLDLLFLIGCYSEETYWTHR